MANSLVLSGEEKKPFISGPWNCAHLGGDTWQPCPALGGNFLARHQAFEAGYSLVITDGVRGWRENRDHSYIVQQADVWAGCVEAGVQQLAELVLEELCTALASTDGGITLSSNGNSSTKSSVAISWGDHSNSLTLSVNAFLEGLPYSWTFELTALPPLTVSELVVVPMAVQLEALKGQLQQQDQQLQQLRQKLSDLTPDGARQQQATDTDVRCSSLRAAAAEVVTGGAAAVLARHLAPDVYAAITTHNTGGVPSVPPAKASGSSKVRPPRAKRVPGLAPRPRPTTDLKAELLTEEHQQARRAQIQALTAAGSTPSVASTQKQAGNTASMASTQQAAGTPVGDQLLSSQTVAATIPAFLPKPIKKKKKLNI